MKKRAKHPGGRPRIDPRSVAAYHLGLSFSDDLREAMLVLVAKANERAAAAGLPAKVTPSGLARAWIEERILVELTQLKTVDEPERKPARKSVYDWINEHRAELRAQRERAEKSRGW
jgi:hypothetical protein